MLEPAENQNWGQILGPPISDHTIGGGAPWHLSGRSGPGPLGPVRKCLVVRSGPEGPHFARSGGTLVHMAKKWPETLLYQLFKRNFHFRTDFRYVWISSIKRKLYGAKIIIVFSQAVSVLLCIQWFPWKCKYRPWLPYHCSPIFPMLILIYGNVHFIKWVLFLDCGKFCMDNKKTNFRSTISQIWVLIKFRLLWPI